MIRSRLNDLLHLYFSLLIPARGVFFGPFVMSHNIDYVKSDMSGIGELCICILLYYNILQLLKNEMSITFHK